MASKKKDHQHRKKKKKIQQESKSVEERPQKLEIILKCDTSGCIEAIANGIATLPLTEVEVTIVNSGVGAISKSDIFLAETCSRLIIGFNVGIAPQIDKIAAEHNVEIRLFEVIYQLLEDVQGIAESIQSHEVDEEILGSAKVIALFKSCRKGIILGCEVLNGRLTLGNPFRILSGMGPVYTGKIESLHIEKDAVKEATKGQQVGLKIKDFKKVAIGDQVESFRAASDSQKKTWQPQGKVFYP